MKNPYESERRQRHRHSQSVAGYRLFLLTRLPLYLIWLFWDALSGWWASRPSKPWAFLLGLPAGFAALAAAVFLFLGTVGLGDCGEGYHLNQAYRAAYFEDHETAWVYLNEALRRGHGTDRDVFLGTRLAETLGEEEKRQAWMRRLTEGPDLYPPALVHEAGRLLQPQGETEPALAAAKALLARALEASPDLTEAHELLGGLLLEEGTAEEALPHLAQAAAASPRAALALAAHHRARADEAEVRRWAQTARERLAERPPSEDPAVRLQGALWEARARAYSGQPQEAVSQLQQTLTVFQGEESERLLATHTLASVYADWSHVLWNRLAAMPPDAERADVQKAALSLLAQALTLHPGHEAALAVVLGLTGLAEAPAAVGALDERLLKTLYATGESPWLAHALAGLWHWGQGAGESAEADLRLAVKIDARAALVSAVALREACASGARPQEEGLALLEQLMAWAPETASESLDRIREVLGGDALGP